MNSHRFSDIVQNIGAFGSLVGGIVALVPILPIQSSAVFLEVAPKILWISAGILLILFGLWRLSQQIIKPSRLLLPDKLRLQTDKVEHLIGREDDIDNLLQHCSESQQIYRK